MNQHGLPFPFSSFTENQRWVNLRACCLLLTRPRAQVQLLLDGVSTSIPVLYLLSSHFNIILHMTVFFLWHDSHAKTWRKCLSMSIKNKDVKSWPLPKLKHFPSKAKFEPKILVNDNTSTSSSIVISLSYKTFRFSGVTEIGVTLFGKIRRGPNYLMTAINCSWLIAAL